MSWLRLDDGFAQHPKIVALPPRDRWTWLELLCYCARYRTDGLIPAGVQEVVRGASPAFLEKVVQLRLLDLDDDRDGFRVHDWDEYNRPRKDDVDEAVSDYLADHPTASANAVYKAVGGSRSAVLAAVKRYRPGTESVPTGTNQTVREPVSRARPVPSRPLVPPTAAAVTTTAEPAPPDTNGAAAAGHDLDTTLERLDALALPLDLADHHHLGLVNAWLDLAEREARDNPAGFALTGIRTGHWPSPRLNGNDHSPRTGMERRERYVRGDGHRLPPDELEYQLAQLGADNDELITLLDLAADLQRGDT